MDGPWSLDLRGDIDAPIGHQGGGQLRLEPSPRPIEIQDGDDDGVGVAQPLQSRDRLRQRVSLDTQQNLSLIHIWSFLPTSVWAILIRASMRSNTSELLAMSIFSSMAVFWPQKGWWETRRSTQEL